MHKRRSNLSAVSNPAESNPGDREELGNSGSVTSLPASQNATNLSNFINSSGHGSEHKRSGRILSRPMDGSESSIAGRAKVAPPVSANTASISEKPAVAVNFGSIGESISGGASHGRTREHNRQFRGKIIATRPGSQSSDVASILCTGKSGAVLSKGRLVTDTVAEKGKLMARGSVPPPVMTAKTRNTPILRQRAAKEGKDERESSRPTGISSALIAAIRNNLWSVGALSKGFDGHAREALVNAAVIQEALRKRQRSCTTYLLSCLVSFVCYGAVAGVMQPGVLPSLLAQDIELVQARVSRERLADNALSALSRISWGGLGSTSQATEFESNVQGVDSDVLDTKQREAAALALTSISRPSGGSISVNREKLVAKVLEIIRRHGVKRAVDARLAAAIVDESKRQNYDPLFVAAVIKTESAFDTNATSSVGAKGLMQIMPATGKYVASFADLQNIPRGKLSEPGYNLKLGIRYLRYLDRLNDGNRLLTLISYNWGPGKVQRTVEGRTSGVPPEVVNYALRILHDHQKWQSEIM